jgi:hypothetical protein
MHCRKDIDILSGSNNFEMGIVGLHASETEYHAQVLHDLRAKNTTDSQENVQVVLLPWSSFRFKSTS